MPIRCCSDTGGSSDPEEVILNLEDDVVEPPRPVPPYAEYLLPLLITVTVTLFTASLLRIDLHSSEGDIKQMQHSKMDYAIDKSVPVSVRNVIDFCSCTNITGEFPATALVRREDVPYPCDCAAWADGHLDDDSFTELFGEGSVLELVYRYSRYMCNGIGGDCFHKKCKSVFNEVPEALTEYSEYIREATHYMMCKIGYVIDANVKVHLNMSRSLEIVIDEIVTKADRDKNRPPTVTNEEVPWMSKCGNKKVGGLIELLCDRYTSKNYII